MEKPYVKTAFREAFVSLLNERPFDSITVVDLARRAGVSRNTFYYWYHDIYGLADDLFCEETQKILRDSRPFGSWQEGFLHATRFASENRRAIFHLYNSANAERLRRYLYEVLYSDMTAAVRQQARDLNAREEDIRDLSVFYSAALMGLVSLWLAGDMRESPDSYIENMGRLLDGNIRTSLLRGRDGAAGLHMREAAQNPDTSSEL